MSQPLRAPLEISFDYTRSLGPTLSEFATALAARRILGARSADGRVHAPPFEFDPFTGRPPTELIEVGPGGTVQTWTWTDHPLEGQPLDRPFGWALIRLDNADTAMLHAVDAGTPDRMRTGMRVRPRWSARTGTGITDIAWFEPDDRALDQPEGAAGNQARNAAGDQAANAAGNQAANAAGDDTVGQPTTTAPATATPATTTPAAPPAAGPEPAPVTMITTPVRLSYEHTVSPGETSYLLALAEGRLIGQRCPACGKVYLPPRGACPVDGVPTQEEVELPDTGIVTTFCVVNVPFLGQKYPSPYVAASVLIDGADIAFQHLILGCPPGEVRMGMRVRAVWKPREEWDVGHNIDHFEPTGEPDAPYDSYAHHL